MRIAARSGSLLDKMRVYFRNVSRRRLVARSELFDSDWYLKNYPDVASARVNPLWHFVRHGSREGRSPGPYFDAPGYLRNYADVRAVGAEPLFHYLETGRSEGRQANSLLIVARSGLFDHDWYLKNYPDVASARVNPLWHFVRHGSREGRSPGPNFDAAWYLRTYADLPAAGTEPLFHYLETGRSEGRQATSLFVVEPDVEAQIAALIDAGDHEKALWAVGGGLSSAFWRDDLMGHSLYLHGLDRQLLRLAEALRDTTLSESAAPRTANMLILSEFYNYGGHSRVAEDLVETLGGAVVILTDLFGSYREGRLSAQDAARRMPKATVHCLQERSFLGRVRELQAVFRTVRPARVLMLTHHPEPMPFVAAASLPNSVTKVFFHHTDHQPALGCTLEGYVHVDFTRHLQEICRHNLARPTIYMPLYVRDQGIKTFSAPTSATFSVVSSGSHVKFRRDGPFAYPAAIAEILRSIGGNYWHIGTLDPSWLDAIAGALRDCGIPEARFKYIPDVPSLWQTLKDIDAHVFIGSFPSPGGRASIEAQGCGYPTVYYASTETQPLMRYEAVVANRELGWKSIPELIEQLRKVRAIHSRLVTQARRHYETGYSSARFADAVRAILVQDKIR